MSASSFMSQKEVESFDLRSVLENNPNAAILAHEGKGGGANLYQFFNKTAAARAKTELVAADNYDESDLIVYSIDEAIEMFCDQ